MEVDLRKYKRYSRNLKYMLASSGLWPDFPAVVQPIIGCYAAFSSLVTAIGVLNFAIHHRTDIMPATTSFGMLVSFLTSFLKICVFLWHHDDLVYLNTVLTTRFNHDIKNKDYRHLNLAHVNVYANFFYGTAYILAVTTGMVIVLLIISVCNGKYTFPYPSIFPFNYEPGGLIYWTLVLIELHANYFIWAVTTSVDSALGLYTLQLCGELKVLGHKFESLGTSSNYKNDLKECIQRHYLVMKSTDTLERVFGFIVIWLAITSAIIQCTLIFQTTLVIRNMNLSIIFIIGYLIVKFVQTFVYAWYGQQISNESESCLKAMYNTQWAGSGNIRFMTDVIIVLSQNPLVIRAMGCMSLQMDIFIKILNTSVSYFFLLRTLNDDS